MQKRNKTGIQDVKYEHKPQSGNVNDLNLSFDER